LLGIVRLSHQAWFGSLAPCVCNDEQDIGKGWKTFSN